jgi:hypothetical protein
MGWHLKYDAGNFNNVFTPISSIIGAVAVIVTLLFLRRQNNLILGQSVRDNIEKELDILKTRLTNETFKFQDMSNWKTMNGIDVYDFFTKIENELRKEPLYQNDLRDYYNGSLHDIEHYLKKGSYTRYIVFLNPFALHGYSGLNRIAVFIHQINTSEYLLEQDKQHFKFRVRNELLENYMRFMENFSIGPEQFMIPLIYKKNKVGKVEFQSFAQTAIGDYYSLFRNELLSAK